MFSHLIARGESRGSELLYLALPSMVHETLYLGKLYGIKRAHIDRLFLCRSPFKAPRAPLKSQSGFRRFIPFTKLHRSL